MKRNFLLLVFVIISIETSWAQHRIYFDFSWEKMKKSTNSFYYRDWSYDADKQLYIAKDYYADGTLQMTGAFKDSLFKEQEGYFEYFNHNSILTQKGKYKNNKEVGKWYQYYPNGNVRNCIVYKNGSIIKDIRYYENGTIWNVSHYTPQGTRFGRDTVQYKTGKIMILINALDTNRVQWIYYDTLGKVISKISYNGDRVLRAKSYTIFHELNSDSIPKYKNALFGKDESDFEAYLKKHLIYPQEAKDREVEGKVDITFLVNIDGSISDIYVNNHVYYIVDDAAIEMIKNIPEGKWKPASINGRSISDFITVTIPFELD